ncbi:hypothetical protein Pnap_3554 [Polaromonas naphthalenivorans CJ2]|uniref:Uncharacterized protein n=1 Tax=Polaromonas naphthalenivorans (strain CJ2) TaxID=365044 RepID=A1VT72_POLNA|nr:hypothetical protein Pnap_3554 [Polaromonas naphthalenivorans CJ2]
MTVSVRALFPGFQRNARTDRFGSPIVKPDDACQATIKKIAACARQYCARARFDDEHRLKNSRDTRKGARQRLNSERMLRCFPGCQFGPAAGMAWFGAV